MKNRIMEWLCGDVARGCAIGASVATGLCVILGSYTVATILVIVAVVWIVAQSGRGPSNGDGQPPSTDSIDV